ncbi:MAG: hypothetical protein PHH09_04610 [Methanoregulaceae archaeon]|jgi:hypothetical protein|nr:hypothetical protein [Methanoregulaceae archaeon]
MTWVVSHTGLNGSRWVTRYQRYRPAIKYLEKLHRLGFEDAGMKED